MTHIEPPQSARGPASEAPEARIGRAVEESRLFKGAGHSAHEAILHAATVEVRAVGAVLFRQGDPVDALVLLGRGRVRLERTTDTGSPFPLSYCGAGEIVGESCLGPTDTRTETATAMEEVELIRVPIVLVRELCAKDAELGGAVLALLAERLCELEDRVASMLTRSVGGRLCEFLLKAAERWGVPSPRGVIISAPITHQEIAKVIGSTRETVTITLGSLRREGLLDVHRRRLIVRDREALAQRL